MAEFTRQLAKELQVNDAVRRRHCVTVGPLVATVGRIRRFRAVTTSRLR
jgi:hypothetical protein